MSFSSLWSSGFPQKRTGPDENNQLTQIHGTCVHVFSGGVTFWQKDFTMVCPQIGMWFRKLEKAPNYSQSYTLQYGGYTRGVYHCKYFVYDKEITYYFYVKGKGEYKEEEKNIRCLNLHSVHLLTFDLQCVTTVTSWTPSWLAGPSLGTWWRRRV